jgi:cobalt/nickel transport system permease protein
LGRFHQAAAGIDHIERLGQGNSRIHRLHPASKALVTLLFIVLTVSIPVSAPSALFPFFLYICLVSSLAGIPLGALFSRVPAALPFALAGGLSNIFFMREPAFVLGGLTVSSGMVSCFSILVKTAWCVCAALLLIATTPFTVLAEWMTAPRFFRPLGLQLALTYRYIGGLLAEAQDMWTAYTLRSGQPKAVAFAHFGPFLGQLLLRSFGRAERVYHAMRCRGFQGVYPGPRIPPPGAADLWYTGLWAALLLAFRLVNISALVGRLAL